MNKARLIGLGLISIALLATLGMLARAQMGAGGPPDFSNVQLSAEHLGGNVYVLKGAVSNMTVSVGDDGAAIVDDAFGQLTEKVMAEIRSIADVPVRFVINTHHHGDHVGGNLNLHNMGAVILSTDNARLRLVNAPAEEGGPPPAGALPVLTFREVTTLHFNGEEVRAFPVAASHTDGDAFIHFVDSDVLVLGDVFLTIGYPYVRPEHAGRFGGYIENLNRAITLSGPNTKIVPGHGVVSTREDVIEYRDMLVVVRDRVSDMIRQGMSLEEILRARPTGAYDDRWGAEPPTVPWTIDEFVTNVYNDLI